MKKENAITKENKGEIVSYNREKLLKAAKKVGVIVRNADEARKQYELQQLIRQVSSA